MNDEKTLWRGTSSQVVNLSTYMVCGLISLLILAIGILFLWVLLVLLVVPAAISFYKWLLNKNQVYEVTTQRIKTTTGIINRITNELELYRVKDMTLQQPFWLRLFGLGTINLVTNDVSSPNLVLAAIPQAAELRENLRNSVEACREQKKVRLAELE